MNGFRKGLGKFILAMEHDWSDTTSRLKSPWTCNCRQSFQAHEGNAAEERGAGNRKLQKLTQTHAVTEKSDVCNPI